jgi:hypothetical protein
MADHPVSGDNGHAPEDEVVPPATEQVHLPGPSYLPVIVAAGVTLAVVGVVFSFVVLAIGLIVALVGVVRWIGEARGEMAELPLEH